MEDPTKIQNIHEGVYVKIKLLSDPSRFFDGTVSKVLSKEDDNDGIVVTLISGRTGNTIQILNSDKVIIERILNVENQFSENKETFNDEEGKVGIWIPLTIQSFLNATGGYLYVGVKDEGQTIEERVVGLEYDHGIMEKKMLEDNVIPTGSKLTQEKFEDNLTMATMDMLNKKLASDEPVGPLIDFDFPTINNTKILEIHVKPSPEPFFFKQLSKKNKEIVFDIYYNNQKVSERTLDEFYYRDGGKKKPIYTFQKFFNFYKNRFKKS